MALSLDHVTGSCDAAVRIKAGRARMGRTPVEAGLPCTAVLANPASPPSFPSPTPCSPHQNERKRRIRTQSLACTTSHMLRLLLQMLRGEAQARSTDGCDEGGPSMVRRVPRRVGGGAPALLLFCTALLLAGRGSVDAQLYSPPPRGASAPPPRPPVYARSCYHKPWGRYRGNRRRGVPPRARGLPRPLHLACGYLPCGCQRHQGAGPPATRPGHLCRGARCDHHVCRKIT